MNKRVFGIAGYMGSGKSTLARCWAERFGCVRLDVDTIAKEFMNSSDSVISAVDKAFGAVENGRINSSKLGAEVFSDPKKLDQLNAIVHPPLIEHVNSIIRHSSDTVIVDAALLPYWGKSVECTHFFWIEAEFSQMISRLALRTGLSEEICEKRLQQQMNLFTPPQISDPSWYFIDNCGLPAVAEAYGAELIAQIEMES